MNPNIIMSRGKHFSAEEIEFIKVNALVMTITEIAKKLNRNYWAIHRKMKEMGISKSHVFTADEDFIIRRMYEVPCQNHCYQGRSR